eukprot:31385-Pelagococcus_subviridis.AAC.5
MREVDPRARLHGLGAVEPRAVRASDRSRGVRIVLRAELVRRRRRLLGLVRRPRGPASHRGVAHARDSTPPSDYR